MKIIVIIMVMLLIAGTRALCQTAVIAHRSHGGSMATFSAVGEDNFGLPPKHIDSVVKITDTSTIEYSTYGVDTVYNGRDWNNPRLGLDSLRRAYPKINFIGFGKKRGRAHAGLQPMPARHLAGVPGGGGHGRVWLLAMLCVAVVPLLAHGIWRAEKHRRR